MAVSNFFAMIEQRITPYGILDFYKKFVIFNLTCDLLDKEIAKELLAITDSFFGQEQYVFISYRSFFTNIDPEAYSVINPKKLAGVAIVSDLEIVKHLSISEQRLYSGSFSFFRTIEDAMIWAETVV
ncbi:hypothetical protein [Patiriisocius hiemis]|uniref:STAS/SEC14 domain-containing protein n=1 Tax=Patiriisocius hiemis TaxID=3075604 RepID=A0ABU2YF61_9FLAO|nr:hypothetical protein [Constantimarinum sp. W242]MDT0555880.1 hypothetical protein [Constantimarinum sp. W242]